MISNKLEAIKNPKSPVSEAYRILRTNIQFSSLDKKLQIIMVTSAMPGEGKSTTASNLAVMMAQGGKKTMLIDCDQRKPNIHKIFGVSNEKGLSNVLVGEYEISKAVHETSQENLFILPSGTRPPNPAELIGSTKLHQFLEGLREAYEYIVIDTPPVAVVTDAQILSQYADGCLLVVSSGETDRQAVLRGKELLMKVNANIIGVILNKIDTKANGYYSYYYQSYHSAEYSSVKKVKRNKRKGFFSKSKIVEI